MQGPPDDRVTEKVDVFSFGVCMWEIWMFGEQIYPGLSLPTIFSGVINGTLRPELPSNAPADWCVPQLCPSEV